MTVAAGDDANILGRVELLAANCKANDKRFLRGRYFRRSRYPTHTYNSPTPH